jgi:hypothetical protein
MARKGTTTVKAATMSAEQASEEAAIDPAKDALHYATLRSQD